jgi:hypothetical protein
MFISQSTAKTYVTRLYEKLGVTNRAQALMAAVQLGLLSHEHGAPVSGARAFIRERLSNDRLAAPRVLSPGLRSRQEIA